MPATKNLRMLQTVLLFGGLASALTLFGLMAEDVAEGDSIFFDLPLLTWLHGHSSDGLNLAMRAITQLGSGWMVAPLVLAAVIYHRRQRDTVIYLLAANGGSALLNVTAKHAFERIRPSYWTPLVHEMTYSFPSGHAMASMALAASLWHVRRSHAHRIALLAAGASYVFAVGTSRVYLGVHYPSDVLAGWCVAFAWCAGLAFATHYQPQK